jgi:hypothetical protein
LHAGPSASASVPRIPIDFATHVRRTRAFMESSAGAPSSSDRP